MLVGVGLLFYLVFPLKVLSTPGCLSKDVTGALVGSRGLSSPSFIIVRFIVLSMPGPYLFRPLKQLVDSFVVGVSGSSGVTDRAVWVTFALVFSTCCPVESLDYTKVSSTMKPIALARALAAFV